VFESMDYNTGLLIRVPRAHRPIQPRALVVGFIGARNGASELRTALEHLDNA
jgi:hypothetical protein